AREGGVASVLIPSVGAENWSAVRALSRESGCAFGLGTHPYALTTLAPEAQLLPDDLEGAVAIGECGLDGSIGVPWESQERVLRLHLERSKATGLPLILHAYRCHQRLLPLLRPFAPLRGVMHSYSGGAELVAAYVDLGLHLSFGGAITWEGARKPLESLRRVPRHRLLLESDGPDQCPRPWKGRSEPAYLPEILRVAERVRGEALAEVLGENAHALGWLS
ncbi:MAG TPA: TatD family hydrolase, partial [Myxococcota bacterium]|nr:TatD family hydrolase [Myxococcota bacterium]